MGISCGGVAELGGTKALVGIAVNAVAANLGLAFYLPSPPWAWPAPLEGGFCMKPPNGFAADPEAPPSAFAGPGLREFVAILTNS